MAEMELAPVALTNEDKIILLGVLVVVMVLVLYFEVRVMRGRAKEVRRASLRKDEAFNALLTTRSIMNVMEREGGDVGGVRTVINRAREAMDRGEYNRAMDLCASAKEELMKCRRADGTAQPRGGEESPFDLDDLADEIVPSSRERGGGTGDYYAGTKLSLNEGSGYLSAKFEIGTAKDELESMVSSGGDASEAEDLISQAQREFDEGRYSKALSLAVKARRGISEAAAADAIPLSPSGVKEEDAKSGGEWKCRSCRSMMLPDDEFCSQCGAPARNKCPKCGHESGEGDKFCRKCGADLQ